MPVLQHQIPLDTAKSWAKRLAKSSSVIFPEAPWKLSQCQLAVAQMLGFDHWHGLEQGLKTGLGQTSTKQPSSSNLTPNGSQKANSAFFPIQVGFGELPETIAAWENLWQKTLALDGVSALHIESRRRYGNSEHRFINVNARVFNQLVSGFSIPATSEMAKMALEALLPAKIVDQLVGDELVGYIQGETRVHVQGYAPCRFQMLPVYEHGWDMVISAVKDAVVMTLDEIGLPNNVKDELLRLSRRPAGAFLFTGSTGTGKSTLMRAVMKNIQVNPGWNKGRTIVINDPIASRPFGLPSDTKHLTDDDTHQAVCAAIRSDPERVLIGEIRSKEACEGMRRFVQSGIGVLTTLNSSPAGVLERLEDFIPNFSWAQEGGVNGWAACRQLPLLCQHCAEPANSTGSSKRGGGCASCRGLGYTGMQLVVGIWEVKNGEPVHLFSWLDQARDLIAQGRIDQADAEDSLGPISNTR